MKKIVSLILTLVLVIAMSSVAAATSDDLTQTTEVKEAGVVIKAPTDWFILTRDLTSETPAIIALGIDPVALKAQFETANIYFNSLPADASSEIVLTMLSNVQTKLVPNYNDLTDAQLEEAKEEILSTVVEESETSLGVIYTKSDIFKNDKATFIVSSVEQSYAGTTIYGLSFTTFIYGRNYNFTFNSYTGPVTPEQEALFTLIVDNAEFSETVEAANVEEVVVDEEEDEVDPDTAVTDEDEDSTTKDDDKEDVKDENTESDNSDEDNNTILIVSIIAGAVVLIGAFISIVLIAKKKK
ncbi:MAG: hypothetical protein K0R15_463 [Clostridiales bacterium]|jgi:hypothetical protein|nr:hypothetical protein [Clostridiales bacterium]